MNNWHLFTIISSDLYVQVGVTARSQDSWLILTAFNETAEHDDWAQAEVESVDLVEYGGEHDSPLIEHVLSLGLERLQDLVKAGSHSVRYHILGGKRYPSRNLEFLTAGLAESNEWGNGERLGDYTKDENDDLSRFHAPFFQESDTGPADAWRWASHNEASESFVHSSRQRALRARGYCMWNLARLRQWPIFSEEWSPPPEPLSDTERLSRRGEMQQCVCWRKMYGRRG